MEALAGDARLIWCVPEEQVEAYRAEGATEFFTGHPGIYEKINEVMDAKPDEWLAFSDDDCTALWIKQADGEVVPTTYGEAVREMVGVAKARRDRFACISMNRNKTWMQRTVTDWGQPSNWLCAVAPGIPERWEPQWGGELVFASKIATNYGRICRCNFIMGEYDYAGPHTQWTEYESEDFQAEILRCVVDRWPVLWTYDKGANRARPRKLPKVDG